MSQRYVVVHLVRPQDRAVTLVRGETRLDLEPASEPPPDPAPVPIPPPPGNPGSGGVVVLLVQASVAEAEIISSSRNVIELEVFGDVIDLESFAVQLERASSRESEVVLFVR